jgi:uncharacterized protein (TIRG00374 family)
MEYQNRSRDRIITIVILVIALLGVILVVYDWEEMRKVLVESDWHYLPGVLLFTFLSYTCLSFAYASVSQMLGIEMGKRELAEVCFISTVVNHILTSGGVVGYSVRYLLMKMYGIPLKDVLASSLLHSYLTSLDMLGFLPLTFIYLMLHAQVPQGIAYALGMMTLLFSLVFIIATGLVVFPSRRSPLLHLIAKVAKIIMHRDPMPWLSQLDETLTRGTEVMRQRPLLLVWTMFLTLVDFTCSIVVMGFCFIALGQPVGVGALITGYVIGIMAGVLSMVPGGFGVQEGSMAGIYMLLGVQFEQAVLAAILFRILYYLLPYFFILLFYNRLLRRAKLQASNMSSGD